MPIETLDSLRRLPSATRPPHPAWRATELAAIFGRVSGRVYLGDEVGWVVDSMGNSVGTWLLSEEAPSAETS